MSNPKATYLANPKKILKMVDLNDIRQDNNDYCDDILGEGITDLL